MSGGPPTLGKKMNPSLRKVVGGRACFDNL